MVQTKRLPAPPTPGTCSLREVNSGPSRQPNTQHPNTSPFPPEANSGATSSGSLLEIRPEPQPQPSLHVRLDWLTPPNFVTRGPTPSCRTSSTVGGLGSTWSATLTSNPPTRLVAGRHPAMPLRDETLEAPPFGPAGEEASCLHPLVDRAESGPEELLPYRLARRG